VRRAARQGRIEAAQAALAERGERALDELGIVRRAGLGAGVEAIMAGPGDRPFELARAVTAMRAALAISRGESSPGRGRPETATAAPRRWPAAAPATTATGPGQRQATTPGTQFLVEHRSRARGAHQAQGPHPPIADRDTHARSPRPAGERHAQSALFSGLYEERDPMARVGVGRGSS
jgi:hypothetical protein